MEFQVYFKYISSFNSNFVSFCFCRKPYLSTLAQPDLEKLGLKAVSAGANPTKLQQAFASAQINGDWTELEREISAVLGISAINYPPGVTPQIVPGSASSTASAPSTSSSTSTSSTSSTSSVSSVANVGAGVLNQASQLVSNFIGGGAADKIGKKTEIDVHIFKMWILLERELLQTYI